MRLSEWWYRLAVLVVVVSVAGLVLGWAVCLFGTSDDGLHCVPAVIATVVAGPLAIGGTIGAWTIRRRMRTHPG